MYINNNLIWLKKNVKTKLPFIFCLENNRVCILSKKRRCHKCKVVSKLINNNNNNKKGNDNEYYWDPDNDNEEDRMELIYKNAPNLNEEEDEDDYLYDD